MKRAERWRVLENLKTRLESVAEHPGEWAKGYQRRDKQHSEYRPVDHAPGRAFQHERGNQCTFTAVLDSPAIPPRLLPGRRPLSILRKKAHTVASFTQTDGRATINRHK